MKNRAFLTSLFVLAFFFLLLNSYAFADSFEEETSSNTNLPNLISIGGGWFDYDRNSPRMEAVDFRLEHRWGMSLLPKASSYFNSWDKYFQIHPMVALESSSRGQLYGGAGFAFDILLGRNIVITPTELVGLYYRGDGKRLGSFVEFRSTLEAGVRFDNEIRITGFIGHISNAGLTGYNPGANTVGGYLHIPTNMVFDY